MQKNITSIAKFILFLGIGLFLVWWSIHKLEGKDYNDFIISLKTANYILLIPVFAILTLSHLSRAIRWRILMRSMNYNPRLSNTFCAVMVGYLANFAFPRLGEVLKCTILGKYEKVPADKLIGTILIERAVDLVCFFIVIVISLLTQATVVGGYAKKAFNKYFLSQEKEMMFIKIAILAIICIATYYVFKFFLKKYRHIKLVEKIEGIYKGVMVGLLSVKTMKNKWNFIFHSLIIWACYVVGTYIGFFAINQTAGLPMLAAFPVLVFGTFATIATPGGIGLYPVFLMEAMQLYNIPESYGTANGWLQWSAQFILIIVVGFACLLILPYINKSKK